MHAYRVRCLITAGAEIVLLLSGFYLSEGVSVVWGSTLGALLVSRKDCFCSRS